jgi:threonyl-tRNA synthetase
MFSQMNIRAEQLPIRAYEYEQYAFRRELAGELAGLRRLRAFTMPDIHTLCKDMDSAIHEFIAQSKYTNQALEDFGLKSYIAIRTTDEYWEANKDWILEFIADSKEPAILELWPARYYYFILKYERPVLSAQGHSACLVTNQIDDESAQDEIEQYGKKRQKYNIKWRTKDGKEGHPIILHCSPTGATERVIWALLETSARYQNERVTGFKTWISPVQCRVMAVSQNEQSYAEEIMNLVNQKQIRCDFDDRDDTIGKKIRSAEVEWIPYTIVVGPKEKESNTISVRKRLIGQPLENGTNEQLNDISLEELIIMINKDLDGLPRRPLPFPFRKFSTRILFRQ